MTSTAKPAQPTSTQAPAPSAPQAPQPSSSGSTTPSGTISGTAAAPAATTTSRPVSYAAAATKKNFAPPVATGTPSTTASQSPASGSPAPGGQQQQQNVRANPSPVNGKPQVPPAVPAVASSSSNGQHSRKSSVAAGPGGATRSNGGPHMPQRPAPTTPNTILFGSLNGPPGSPAPQNASVVNPAGSSQPTNTPPVKPVGGGGQGGPANIQFGSFPTEGNSTPQQQYARPVSMSGAPPIVPGPTGPAHTRRDSTHSQQADIPPAGPGMARNSMPPNGARRNNHQGPPGGYQGQYNRPPNQQFNNYGPGGVQYGGAPTQPRGGMGGNQYQHNPQGQPPMFNNRGPARSPGMHHASPMTTPNMQSAQLAGTPQPMYPAYGNTHMAAPPHHFVPQGGYYDASQQYNPYPPYGVPQPHTSPRPQFNQMPTPTPAYVPMYQPSGASMSRTNSVNTGMDMNRPPSTIPPTQMGIAGPPTPVPASPGPSNRVFQRPATKRASNAIEIKDPTTGQVLNPTKTTPSKPSTPTAASTPPATPAQKPQTQIDAEAAQRKKEEMKAAVKRQVEERRREEEERKKREEEERIAKEKAEEERIAKEKAEEEERKRKEEEEKARKEEEERLAKEAEEKAKAEEEERLKKEAEEKARKEEEERIAKEKAEQEAREKEAREKEEAEAKANAEKEKEKAEAEAKESEAKPAIEVTKEPASEDAPAASTEATSDDKSMPPPTLTGRRGLKPSHLTPINIPGSVPGEKPLATPAMNSLRSARFIDDINSIKYPESILSPNPALNPKATMGKFKYEKDFLMQFQDVFKDKPYEDWDERIRETVGEPDSARPSGLGRQPSRGVGRSGLSTPGGFAQPMGVFAAGSTSQQRFEASTKKTGGLGTFGQNPLGTLPGSFRATPMSRTGSGQGMSGFNPSSPKIGGGRQQSRTQSKRGGAAGGHGGAPMERSESRREKEKDPAQNPQITIPAAEIKPLVISNTGWRPRSVAAAQEKKPDAGTEENALMSPEMVQRKVKAALNKMTPEKFDKISDQILEIASQSRMENDGRTLRQVIQLTFEKATDEAAWSSMYAKFCKRMLETMDPNIKDENIKDKMGNVVTGGALFRKYLLNRCQEEFERGWKINLPPKPEGVTDEAAMLSDEYYIAAAAKRRGLGLIQFIGELFKLGMLTERIMHECVKKLVDFEGVPEEEEAESLVRLLKTVGRNLDETQKSRPLMDVYFARIKNIIEMKGLNSRIRFMLMDLVDLRNQNWQTKEADKGPKTIAEIREEARRIEAEKEAQKIQSRQRPQGGRGDARSNSYGFNPPPDYASTRQTVNMDDLKGLKNKSRIGTSGPGGAFMGPASLLGRSSSSGTAKKPAGASGENSRSATPQPASANKFSLLMSDTNEGGDATSPPASTSSSPPVIKSRINEIARQ